MSNEYRYLKITGGKILEEWKAFLIRRAEQHAARMAFAKEVGANQLYGNHRRISAVGFGDRPVPENWHKKKDGLCIPRNTKAGHQLRARMGQLPCENQQDFHQAVVGGFAFIHELKVLFIFPELIGDVLVIHVPRCKEGDDWKPEDAVELKASEYWALKEAQPE